MVLDRSKSKHDHLWYLLGPAELLARKGVVAQRFPLDSRKKNGEVVVYRVVLRPLCWRARGETCLVARSGGSKRRTRQFRLSRIDPAGP